MLRPKAFTGTFHQRVGLDSLQGLLAWLYTTHKSDEAGCYSFWLWFTGVTERQVKQGGPGDLTSIIAHTRKWKWPTFQRDLRSSVEAVLEKLDKPIAETRRPHRRILQAVADSSGRPILSWRPTLSPKFTAADLASFAIDELFTDLHGVSAKAVGRCRQCAHFFVRGRAGNGLYCSQRCRYAAAYLRKHGSRLAPRRRARRLAITRVK
jgi:hypothetical protein